jgi:hypothetical protein
MALVDSLVMPGDPSQVQVLKLLNMQIIALQHATIVDAIADDDPETFVSPEIDAHLDNACKRIVAFDEDAEKPSQR